MKLYISGVPKESYLAWHTPSTGEIENFIFLEPYDFFEKIQTNHSMPDVKFAWLYQAPWFEINNTNPSAVGTGLKTWMNLQHSIKSCLLNFSDIAFFNITKKSCAEIAMSNTSSPVTGVSNHSEYDPFMENTIKSIAPSLYKTFSALESNTLSNLENANEDLSSIEERNATNLIAFFNCYKKQTVFDALQKGLELENSKLQKQLVSERALKLKAEEKNSHINKDYLHLTEQFNLEQKLYESRIHFAETQLIEYFETVKNLTCVIEDASQALIKMDHLDSGKITND